MTKIPKATLMTSLLSCGRIPRRMFGATTWADPLPAPKTRDDHAHLTKGTLCLATTRSHFP